MSYIKCSCGKEFLGWEDKEDTCPDCLRRIRKEEDYNYNKLRSTTEKEKEDIKEVMDKARFNLVSNCDKCENEDSIDSLSGLCFNCLKGGL